jgi:hypothetical protein
MRLVLLMLITISAFGAHLTGYIPNPERHRRIQIREFPSTKGAHAFDPIPDEYYAPEQRVFSQQCGDCWAQGGATAFESVVALYDKVSIFVSRQQVIDCSGDGSCNGGDISLNDYVKPRGAVYESDYPYVGSNQNCKSNAPIHQKADSEFQVSDMTVPTFQRAMMETGPMEICGASGALGNGGWVERNPSGGTDHCYSFNGWYQGAKHGHKAGIYFIIVNSWGSDWGDNGKGYYLMAQDGVHFDGDVITEAGGVVYKPACTPQPSADAGADKSILLEVKP